MMNLCKFDRMLMRNECIILLNANVVDIMLDTKTKIMNLENILCPQTLNKLNNLNNISKCSRICKRDCIEEYHNIVYSAGHCVSSKKFLKQSNFKIKSANELYLNTQCMRNFYSSFTLQI
jgi:hypothetical protein